MTALGTGAHAPFTVMLAYVPEGMGVRFPEAKSPPVHVYGEAGVQRLVGQPFGLEKEYAACDRLRTFLEL